MAPVHRLLRKTMAMLRCFVAGPAPPDPARDVTARSVARRIDRIEQRLVRISAQVEVLQRR